MTCLWTMPTKPRPRPRPEMDATPREAEYLSALKAAGIWKAKAPASYLPADRQNVNQENDGRRPVRARRNTTSVAVLEAIAAGHGNRAELVAATGLRQAQVASCIYRLRSEGRIITKTEAATADARYRLTETAYD